MLQRQLQVTRDVWSDARFVCVSSYALHNRAIQVHTRWQEVAAICRPIHTPAFPAILTRIALGLRRVWRKSLLFKIEIYCLYDSQNKHLNTFSVLFIDFWIFCLTFFFFYWWCVWGCDVCSALIITRPSIISAVLKTRQRKSQLGQIWGEKFKFYISSIHWRIVTLVSRVHYSLNSCNNLRWVTCGTCGESEGGRKRLDSKATHLGPLKSHTNNL
jgi:hypothetical protein